MAKAAALYWIAQRLRDIDLTAKEFAAGIEKRRVQAQRIANGQRRLLAAEVPVIAYFLDLPVAEVVKREAQAAESIPTTPVLAITRKGKAALKAAKSRKAA